LKFRHAKQSDKNNVLRFCTNTFEWGDYIEQVWDGWCADPNGYLMIAEENEVIAAVSHAYLCPNRNRVWLEGIRVNPDFRRRAIATELIKNMLEYGKEHGAQDAAGLVSVKNAASQGMMEKNGFVAKSRWIYCYSSTNNNIHEEPDAGQSTTTTTIATLEDKEMIRSYLKQSQIFRAAGENYAHLWRWYYLNLDSDFLQNLIDNRKIIVMTNHDNSIIHGLMIVNKNDNSMFQIGYIDTVDVLTLRHLIAFVINLAYSELREKKFETIQMFVPQTSFLKSAMTDLKINQYGQFLLYRWEF
jgi:GNAT superfamily N-acetyltransferase